MENTDDDMTITFADFGHFIGSMIPKSSTFNAHFRPQFHACQGTVAIYIKYFLFRADSRGFNRSQILNEKTRENIFFVYQFLSDIFFEKIFLNY